MYLTIFLTGNGTQITTEPVTVPTIPTNPTEFTRPTNPTDVTGPTTPTVTTVPTKTTDFTGPTNSTQSTRGKLLHGFNHYEYSRVFKVLMSPYTCLVYLAAYTNSYSTYQR